MLYFVLQTLLEQHSISTTSPPSPPSHPSPSSSHSPSHPSSSHSPSPSPSPSSSPSPSPSPSPSSSRVTSWNDMLLLMMNNVHLMGFASETSSLNLDPKKDLKNQCIKNSTKKMHGKGDGIYSLSSFSRRQKCLFLLCFFRQNRNNSFKTIFFKVSLDAKKRTLDRMVSFSCNPACPVGNFKIFSEFRP
jgi:hypothetical protein